MFILFNRRKYRKALFLYVIMLVIENKHECDAMHIAASNFKIEDHDFRHYLDEVPEKKIRKIEDKLRNINVQKF